jgi:hypothetical protein
MDSLLLLPSGAPFRIDQVTSSPALLGGLVFGQLLIASLLQATGHRRPLGLWWVGFGLMLGLETLFFGLASWGTSDIAKLNVFFALDRAGQTVGEPFWALAGPLVLRLPYRMAAVHGLVAAGYGAAAMLLARHWGVPALAGWWSLLITTSPLLRGLLQNGQTRQALAVLLILPLMLRVARLLSIRMPLLAGSVLWSALCHTSFPANLGFALAPVLVRGQGRFQRLRQIPRLGWWMALAALVVGGLLGLLAPALRTKLHDYTGAMTFFSHYAVRREVLALELCMGLSVLRTAWRRQLGAAQLLACDRSRLLLLFGLLYGTLQATVWWEWFPQITFRLADPVGLFLLISFLAWLHRYRAHSLVLPLLLVTLASWLLERVLPSGQLPCGHNDEFLCIPDRMPWLIRY